MMSTSSETVHLSKTAFEDITSIDFIAIPKRASSGKKKKKPVSSDPARGLKTNNLVAVEKHYEDAADIINRRLRVLRKRMQRVEKNESTYALYNSSLNDNAHAHNSSSPPCPLNSDQLKAIENKPHLAELICELERLSEQVNSWMLSSPSNLDSLQQKMPPAQSSLVQAQKKPHSDQREILELWVALAKLDTIPSTLLPAEDLMIMRSVNSVFQSVLQGPSDEKNLELIISWIAEKETEEDPSSFLSLLPSYPLVRHCTKKILAYNPNPKPEPVSSSKKTFLLSKKADSFPHNESAPKTEASQPETGSETLTGLSVDTAIINSIPSITPSVEASLETKKQQFVLKKIEAKSQAHRPKKNARADQHKRHLVRERDAQK